MQRNPQVGADDRELVLRGHAGPSPGNGPFLSLELRVRGRMIASAEYQTYQCPGCHACGKAVCELVIGKNVEQAGLLTREDLVQVVGDLPRHRQICYGLAVLALDDALKRVQEHPSA